MLTYSAVAYYTVSSNGDNLKSVARAFILTKNKCLQVITSAFRATLQHYLEVEAGVPPLDLYLNVRKAVALERI